MNSVGTVARAALLWLSFSICFGTATGQEPQFQPAQHGNGPLLYFVRPEDSQGRPYSGSDRTEVLYQVDPSCQVPPQVLWRGGNPRPWPLARLKADMVLFEHEDRTYLLELTKGEATPVLPTKHETKAFGIVGTKVYFVERLVPYRAGGVTLRSQQGQTVVRDYYKARDRMFVVDVGATRRVRRCGDMEVERILGVDGDTIWAISAGQQRHLLRITGDGKGEEIVPLDSHWVLPMSRYAFSPTKRYLAFGLLDARHDFHKERELVVVDILQKRRTFVRERLPVSKWDKFGGEAPRLTVDWMNNTTLAVGGGPATQLLVDVEKGRLLESTLPPSAAIDSAVQRPDRLDQFSSKSRFSIEKTRGHFESKMGLYFYKGAEAPIAGVWNRDRAVWTQDEMAVDQKGEWASFSNDDGTYLIDGRKKQKSLLLRGWSYDLVWLPAVE